MVMKLSRKKILIIVLALAGMGVGLGRIIIIRMINYLDDLEGQITAQRTELEQAHHEIQANSEFVRNWGRIRDFLVAPTEERRTRLNTYIQKLESESKVQITNYGAISEKPAEGRPDIRILSLDNLRFSCNLESLVELLARLDADDQRLLRITRLRIDAVLPASVSSLGVAGASRLESDMPGAAPMDLTVEMALAIPTAAPIESAPDGREN